MRIGRGRWCTLKIPPPVPFYPPQIQHDLTWDWTCVATAGSRWLTTSAMAWSFEIYIHTFDPIPVAFISNLTPASCKINLHKNWKQRNGVEK
jgi:hypothetical protein